MTECIRPAGAKPSSGYTNQGCRCAECSEGHRLQQAAGAAARRAALTADPTIATHGLASTYQNYGCRCEPCKDAQRKAIRDRAVYYSRLKERRQAR